MPHWSVPIIIITQGLQTERVYSARTYFSASPTMKTRYVADDDDSMNNRTDIDKYWKTIEQASLIPDLQVLADGDLTEVGSSSDVIVA